MTRIQTKFLFCLYFLNRIRITVSVMFVIFFYRIRITVSVMFVFISVYYHVLNIVVRTTH